MEEYKSENHALHNEEVCKYLFVAEKFNDWVITTAFYSGYHFLLHQLFPIKFIFDGKKSSAISFDEYCSITKNTRNKHKTMRKLVENNCPPHIAVAYNQLLDNSWSARYNKYTHSKKIAKLSLRRLEQIKVHSLKK